MPKTSVMVLDNHKINYFVLNNKEQENPSNSPEGQTAK